MKKLISALLALAMIPSVSVMSKENGLIAVTADKTAQWTRQEAEAGYDMRIHGWYSGEDNDWRCAAYMGFTLPDEFEPSEITSARLKLDTVSFNGSGAAYLYECDYDGFVNGTQYEGDDIPKYNENEIVSFTSASETGEFVIDITNYIAELDNKTDSVAFRIDVKSGCDNNSWTVGSCTSGTAPVLELDYNEGAIKNSGFSKGDANWTIIGDINTNSGCASYSGNGKEARISQTVTGLENGVYDLTVNTKNTGVDGIYYVYAKTKGHTMASTSVPVSAEYTTVTVPGVVVEDGTCDIGLYAKGNDLVSVDNFAVSEGDDTRVHFLKGGEISKLTYVEDKGGKFYYSDGTEGDALQIMAENGFNLARIRPLNNPGKGRGDGTYYLPEGYQTVEDCLELARRAKDKGMQIMFSMAYSDYWSDGGNQIIPYEWQEYINNNSLSGEAMVSYLETKVYEFTKDVMLKLIEQGTSPEFVSIGNEIQYGMLFGNWEHNNGLYNKAEYLERFLNAGARAVRETSPESKIVIHTDNGGKVLSGRKTFTSILDKVDYDVIGVSYYPFYDSTVSIDTVVSEFNTMINKYDKDVIIMETGYNWAEKRGDGYEGQLEHSGYYQEIYGETQEGQRAFLTELYSKLKQVAGGRCIGDMYWDPVMIYDGGKYVIGWAVKESDDWTDGNVVSNSTIFDFEGKEVAGQKAMKYNTDSKDNILITGRVSGKEGVCAETDIMVMVNGNVYNVTTDKFGDYIVSVPYPKTEQLSISAFNSMNTYNTVAPYDGIIVDDIDFDMYNASLTVNANSNEIKFQVNTENTDDDVYVAIYNKDKILVGCAFGKQSGSFDVDESGSYTLKAYIWNDGMAPCIVPVSETVNVEL